MSSNVRLYNFIQFDGLICYRFDSSCFFAFSDFPIVFCLRLEDLGTGWFGFGDFLK